jgi:hypothetical protein
VPLRLPRLAAPLVGICTRHAPASRSASVLCTLACVAFALSTCGAGSSVAISPPPGGAVPLDDARDHAALDACSPSAPYVAQWTAEQPLASHCGQLPGRHADVARTVASARPLDAATAAHVRAIFDRGARLHRRADVFALVGDSTTLEPQFMTPFGAGMPPFTIDPAAHDALAIAPGPDGAPRDVIAWFRGVRAYGALDSFRAPRAAKTGARATWPLEPDAATGVTPIDAVIASTSPAYAVVLFGTNDAELFVEPLDRLATRFAASLDALAAALESRGVVPILTTVPRHMRAWGMPDCGDRTARTNARIMIQTTVVSAAVSDVAGARHLPLVDLRDALDPLIHRGIASDGVHPSFYPRRLGGGGMLDEAGLQCGYNARSLATLRMLALVRRAIEKP